MSDRRDNLFHRLVRLGSARRPQAPSAGSAVNSLQFESLENRRLLVGTTEVPSIQGAVFVDSNQDTLLTAGEERTGVTVQLFTDDGDGVFETNGEDVQFGTNQVTDADGEYCFTGLDGTDGYFVIQPQQLVGTVSLGRRVSSLIQPGRPNLLIDDFTTSQSAQANPPAPSSDGSTLLFANESEVIGAERDMYVELVSGVGEVQLLVNPFGLLPVLQFNSSSGVQGRAIVSWDGQDISSNPIPDMGLGGRDLTQGGVNTGIGLQLGIDAAGAGEVVVISLYQGSAANVSQATAVIPTTDGSAAAYLFIPFTDFSGPVSPDNVDAIQLELGNGGVPSADGQLAFIGAVGPAVANVLNDAGTDLAITKSNLTDNVVAGAQMSYTILVENRGPLDATGISVDDTFPSELLNPSFTSVTTGTVSGNTASGTGNINDTIDITAGSTVTYTVTGTLTAAAVGIITNTADVSVPETGTELDTTNNTDNETDTAVREVDLSITKSNGVTLVRAGDTITYTIVVTNGGPSDVTGATVTDTFPAELTNVTYTSTTDGTVSGNTINGTGNLNDTVNLAAGSSITYLVTATVASTQATQISNTATVTAPTNTTETDTSDNTATDIDQIPEEVDLTITKTNNATTATPGQSLTYQIVASNLGPRNATGATIADTFPAGLTNVNYTSVAAGGATGNTASGSGAISDTVNIPVNGTITYTVTGTVSASATGQLSNTATVSPANGVTELTPTNNTATDTDTLVPLVDLAVTKTNNVTTAAPNQVLNYVITVTNTGPSDAVGATLTDTFPAQLTNVSFTSTASGGATGNSASGTGNLNQTLNLPVGATVTYQVSATVSPSSTINILNTTTTTAAAGTTEVNLANNTASDEDTLIPGVDLAITKTNNTNSVVAGRTTTYTIVVSNSGPNPATGVQVVDNFPALLSNVTYTSTAANGATGNTNGSGNLNDTVNLPVNSTITYTVQGLVDINSAGQSLVNQVTVTAPNTVTELNPTNNTSTDTDSIDELLARISGFVFVDLDNDGIRDANESGIAGVEILLFQNGAEIDDTTTDNSGAYQFNDLRAGSYEILQTQPDDFRDGIDHGGSQGSVVENDRLAVTLAPGDDATEMNFGELTNQPSKRELLASNFRT